MEKIEAGPFVTYTVGELPEIILSLNDLKILYGEADST